MTREIAGASRPSSSERSLDTFLEVELWTSWASLLRAYTGADGLNSTDHAVVEVGPDEVHLGVNTR